MEITKEFINTIIDEFAKEKLLFANESQFQFDFAWRIREKMVQSNCKTEIFLEREIIPKHYTDIVIKSGNCTTAIELKYKLAEKEILYEVDEREIRMHAQGAPDNGCYDFCKDILRLEELKKLKNEDKINRGFAIIITNSPLYWGKGIKDESNWEPFCLNKQILKGSLNWKNKASSKEREAEINLNQSYEIVWKDYFDAKEIGWYENGIRKEFNTKKCKHHPFKYLVIEV